MFEFFQEMERGIESSIRESGGVASPRKRYTLEVARLGRRLYSGEGKMAWCGVVAPFDLLSAMGVTSCFVEFVGAMLASTGMAGEFIETADHAGFSSDACSFHRSVLGAAMKDTMPVPDILIGTTNPCSGGLAVIENLARHFSRPLTILHIPQDESGGNVAYLADQIRGLARFVTDHTGHPLDPERLRHAIENTNRVHAIGSEVYELARHVPSPATSKDLANFGIVMALFLGSDGSVEVAETYRDAFKARIAEGKGGVPGEKVRLLWIQNRIQFRHPLEKMLEEQYGAAIVIDELNDFNWDPIDPDEPFEGHGEAGDLDPLQRHDRNKGGAPQEARPGVPGPRRRQPLQLGLPPGDRRPGAHRGGTQGDRGPRPQPRGGLCGRPEVHRGAAPHPARGLPGDAGGEAVDPAITVRSLFR